MEEVFSSLVDGTPHEVSDSDVLHMYEGLGYVPGDPNTDQGGTIPEALTLWRSQGVGGRKILGWAEVNLGDRAELLSACWLFGGLYCGFNVPQSAIDQFRAGEPWNVVSDDGGIVGGHCVPWVGYNATGPVVVTWGKVQPTTWAFFKKYFDEVAAVIGADYDKLGNRTIEGFSEQQLEKDLDAIGGNVPVGPSPSPPPPPSPSPTPPPTPTPPQPPPGFWSWLESLIAWLEHHFPGASASSEMEEK
jgi:hypothetical protein